MKHIAVMIERQTKDYFQRIRISLANLGGANELIDKLQGDVAEHVAGDVCATLGIDYDNDPNPKRHPWARNGFAKKQNDTKGR